MDQGQGHSRDYSQAEYIFGTGHTREMAGGNQKKKQEAQIVLISTLNIFTIT